MVSETVEVKGHIIDSLVLPKILDTILGFRGAGFDMEKVHIGRRKADTSHARLVVSASSRSALDEILSKIEQMGAQRVHAGEVRLERARKPGVYPSRFYSTTNLPTEVYYRKKWRPVENVEMDCGIRIGPKSGRASTVPFNEVKRGDHIVCTSQGVRVTPLARERGRDIFQFMASSVSSEKPKVRVIRALAEEIHQLKVRGKKILVVGGPALIHTGAAPYLEELIENGFIDVLFAGNGFAVHDIESQLLGTSLGVDLKSGKTAHGGHDHHMRAINQIRDLGGIRAAVRKKVLKSGIMHACIKRGVHFVLAGSIRDDGPLPEVITDAMEAQRAMRSELRGVELALMLASTLHSIATGNMLPATCRTICVDINPAVVTKLTDRGTFQNVGLVTDSESFLRELARQLRKYPARRRSRKKK